MFGVRFSSADSSSEEMRNKSAAGGGKKTDVETGDWRGVMHLSREDVKKSTFLRFCNSLSALASLQALSSAALHSYFSLLPCNHFIALQVLGNWDALVRDVPVLVVRLAAVFFALIVVFCEREGSYAQRNFAFLDSWVARGIFIIFLGSLHLVCKVPCELLLNYQVNLAVGSSALVLGAIYLVLGCLCFRQLRNRSIEAIRRRKQVEQQARSLADQKGEIEFLLAETQKKLELA